MKDNVNVCDEILKTLCVGVSKYLRYHNDFNGGYIISSMNLLKNLGFISHEILTSLSFRLSDDEFTLIIDKIVDTLGSSDFKYVKDIYCDWRKGGIKNEDNILDLRCDWQKGFYL